MAEDIIFVLDGDASGAVAAIDDVLRGLQQISLVLDGLQEKFAVFDSLTSSVQIASDTLTQVTQATSDFATATDNVTQSVTSAKDQLAQTAQATSDLVTTTNDVTQSVTSFNDELAALDDDLFADIQALNDVTASFDELDHVIQPVIQTMQSVQDELIAFDDDLGQIPDFVLPAAEAIRSFGEMFGVTDEQIAVLNEDIGKALINFDTLPGPLAATAQAAADEAAAFQDAANALGLTVNEAQNVLQVNADLAASAALASEAMARFLDILNNLDSSLTSVEAMDMLTQAADTLGVSLDNLRPAIADAIAGLDESSASADAQANAFSNAANALQAHAQATADAIAAQLGLTSAMDETTVASDAKTSSLQAESDAMNGDVFMVMMLAQMLGQLIDQFLQTGEATQLAISRIEGLANPTLTLAKNSGVLSNMIQGVSADSLKYGIDMTTAANALYFIQSQNYGVSDSMKILSTTMEFAAATGTSVDVIARGLTSSLKAYGATAAQAAQYTDVMTAAITNGSMTGVEYSNVIGQLSAAGAKAGFSFKEVNAALDVMTQINPRVRQDSQNLSNMFIQLSDNADKIKKAADGLNLKFDETKFKSMDLGDKLKYISQVAGGDTTPAFEKLMLNATSARAGFYLLTASGQAYADALGKMNQSQGRLDEAFGVFETTITAGSDHIKAALSVLSYQFVTLITPMLLPFLMDVANAIGYVATHMQQFMPIIIALSVLIGGVFIGAIAALIGWFAGVMAGTLAVIGPLALFAGAIAAIAFPLINFIQHNAVLQNALSGTGVWLRQIGSYLENMFGKAWESGARAMQQFGAWAAQHVIPPLQTILANLILFGNRILANVVPALDTLSANLRPVGSFIMTSVVPAIGTFIDKAMALGVYVSGNIMPIMHQLGGVFQTIGNVLLVVGGIIAGIWTAFQLIAVNAFIASGGLAALWGMVTGFLPLLGALAAGAVATAGAFIALNWPFLLIGAAVAVAIIAFVKMYQSLAPFRTGVNALISIFKELWGMIVSQVAVVFQQLWTTIQTQLAPAWQHLVTAIQPFLPIVQAVAAVLGGVLLAVLVLLVSIIAGLIQALGQFLLGLIQIIGGVAQFVSGVIQLFIGLIQFIGGWLGGNKRLQEQGWNAIKTGVTDIVKGLGDMVMGLFRAFLGTIIGFITGFVNSVISWFHHLSDVVVGHSIWPDMLNAMIQHFVQFVQSIIQSVVSFVSNIISHFMAFGAQMMALFRVIWSAIQVIWQTVLQAIGALLRGKFSDFLALIMSAGQQMQNLMRVAWAALLVIVANAIQNVVHDVQNFVSNLANIFGNLAAQAVQWGLHFIQSLASGITAGIGAAISAAQNVAGAIASILHHTKPDAGPMADDDQWMHHFGDSLATGLNAQVGKVRAAAINVASSIAATAPTTANFSSSTVQATNNSEMVTVLKAILGELQKQKDGGNNNALGHTLPSTNIATTQTVTNNYGSSGIASVYQQLNVIAGLANEYGTRGANAGLGI